MGQRPPPHTHTHSLVYEWLWAWWQAVEVRPPDAGTCHHGRGKLDQPGTGQGGSNLDQDQHCSTARHRTAQHTSAWHCTARPDVLLKSDAQH